MFLKRAIHSLRHRWKKVLAHTIAYTVLFSLCFGAILVTSTVRGQQEFLQGALQRAVTLRGESYKVRVSKTATGGIVTSMPYEDIQKLAQDDAVEGWNVCTHIHFHIEGCQVLYPEERAESYEKHRYGQLCYVHEDGTTVICVRDSKRSQAFVTTGFQLIEGEHFSGDDPGDIIMVSEDFARLNDLHVGDKLRVSNIKNDDLREPFAAELELTGIFRTPDTALMKGIGARPEEMAVIPLAVRSRLLGKPVDSFNFRFATFYLKEGTDQQAFFDRLHSTLPITKTLDNFYTSYSEKPPEDVIGMDFDEMAEYLEAHPRYQIQQESQWYDRVAKPLDQEAKLAGAMLYLLLGSVVLIIALIVALSIKERRREVGVLLSMGESKIKVIGQLALEMALPILVSLGIGIAIGTSVGVPVTESLCNGVYEQTAADADRANKNVTLSFVQYVYSNPWSLSERQFFYTLTDCNHADLEVFPRAEVRMNTAALAIYAFILLAAALLALLAQSMAILTAKPAKILLNRR